MRFIAWISKYYGQVQRGFAHPMYQKPGLYCGLDRKSNPADAVFRGFETFPASGQGDLFQSPAAGRKSSQKQENGINAA
ncbi:hypothetical protein [Arenibacterium sp. CAU 1754]